jgi:hypothetical protein
MKNAPNDYRSLLDALGRCVAACEYCADACLQEDHVQMMVSCIRTDRDCADIAIRPTRRTLSRSASKSARSAPTSAASISTTTASSAPRPAANVSKPAKPTLPR